MYMEGGLQGPEPLKFAGAHFCFLAFCFSCGSCVISVCASTAIKIEDGHHDWDFDNGDVYEGPFKGGRKHGKGAYKWADGRMFEGTYDQDVMVKGKWTSADGEFVYVGSFKDGRKNGYGKLTLTGDGTTYEGGWANDQKHGEGTFKFGGNTFVGNFSNGKKNGHGDFTFADGRRYVGNFQDDDFHGAGTLYNADGTAWKGTFANGQKNGTGYTTTSSGFACCKSQQKFKETWVNGTRTKVKPVRKKPKA